MALTEHQQEQARARFIDAGPSDGYLYELDRDGGVLSRRRKAARAAAFKRVWQDTHPDFRGKLADGTLSVMAYAKFGGGLVTAETITDAELAERLQAVRK